MSRSVSSAEPEKLFRYSDVATGIDHELVSESHRLAGKLGQFETRCTEPDYKVSVSHLANALRSHSSQSEYTDGWVRDVGKAFQLADGMRSGWRSPPISPVERLVILPALPGLAIALLLPILRVPYWLGKMFSHLPWVAQGSAPSPSPSVEPAEPGPPSEPSAPIQSRLGELMRRAEEEEKAGAELEVKPVAPPSPPPAAKSPAPLYQVPALKQTPKSYECAPTSVSMILEYYHNEHHRSLSPKKIIQGLGTRFTSSSGIAADKLVEGLQEMKLGYQTVEWKSGLNKEALVSELREGPLIAQVHLHLGTSGYPHMVVVTGISDDGNKIHLNDPWTGQHRELTWEAFEKTWTFPEHPRSSQLIVRIRP